MEMGISQKPTCGSFLQINLPGMFCGQVAVARCIGKPKSNLGPCNACGAFEFSPANNHSW